MANIPSVPGAEVLQAPNQPPRLNAGAFSGPARGRIAMGEAIARAGQVFGELALQKQETVNTAALAHADIVMRQGTDSFLSSLQHDPQGYDKWNDEFASQAATIKEQAFAKYQGMSLSPLVKQKLNLAFEDWQNRTASQVNVLSTRAQINDTAAQLDHASDLAAQQGSEGGALAPYQSPGAKHIFTDVELQTRMDGVKRKIQNYEVDSGLMNNPADTVEQLEAQTPTGRYKNFPDLDPNARLAKIRMGTVLTNRAMMDNYREVYDQVEGGRIYSRDELENMVSQHHLRPNAVDLILKKQTGVNRLSDQPTYAARAMAEINDQPEPQSPEERIKAHLAIVSSPDYLKLMPDVRRQVDDFMTLKWGGPSVSKRETNPVQSRVLAEAAADFKAGLFMPMTPTHPVLGNWWEKLTGKSRVSPETVWEPDFTAAQITKWQANPSLKPREVQDQEKILYAHYLTSMRAFFQANPQATDEQAERESQRLKLPQVMMATAHAISVSPPQPVAVPTPVQIAPENGGYVEGQIYTYADGKKVRFMGGDYRQASSFQEVK